MLMYAQRPHRIPCRLDLPYGLILPDIPQLDLSVPAPGDKFPEAPALHVDAGDPLLVPAPVLHHCHRGFLAHVEDADRAVAVAGAENVAGDLVGG